MNYLIDSIFGPQLELPDFADRETKPMIRSMSTLLVALLAGTLSLYAATQAAPQGSQTKPKPKTAPAVQEPEPEYTDEEYDAYEKATQEKDLD
ncbi:MAG: hypothetical protein DMG07_15115, partial [Acidobacteria bacterium]